jgi:hypothetical protein
MKSGMGVTVVEPAHTLSVSSTARWDACKEARMRLRILMLEGTLVLAVATFGSAAEVNCKQVNKYLQTGRSVQDVAQTMVIDESEVEKCKAQAPSDATGGGAGDTKGRTGEDVKGTQKGTQGGQGHY